MRTLTSGIRRPFPLVVFALLVLLLIGCSSAVGTATPVSPVATNTPQVPTAIASPTATLTLGAPTNTPVVTARPKYGGTLRYSAMLDVKSMDPVSLTGEAARTMSEGVYEKLVDVDAQFNLIPGLAQSWETTDNGKSVVFHLVKNAKFHDGTKLDASAVRAHFDRVLDQKVGSRYRGDIAGPVDKITVGDELTVVFSLKTPNRPFLAILTDFVGFIESPSAVAKYDSYSNPNSGDYGRNPIGTGPFRLTRWVPDSYMTAGRFSEYWDAGKPYLDAFTIQNVPDPTVRLAMARTNETDVVMNVPASDVVTARRSPNVQIAELEGGRFTALAMSVDREPWNKKPLRAAIAYAIDRQSLVETYYLGAAKPGYSVITTGWGANPNLKVYDYNVQKAKDKLIEAGYVGGVTFPYWCGSVASSIQLCETVQAQLRAVGINLQIEQVLPAEKWSKTMKREIHFIDTYWFPRADPAQNLTKVFSTGGGSNAMAYRNPEVDALLAKAAAIYDTAEAKKLYDQVQGIIVEDAHYVVLAWLKEFVLLNKDVRNFQFIPDLYLRMKNIWLDR